MGFDARFCVTPEQIEPVNRAFSPSDVEVAWAEKILAAREEAERSGIADSAEVHRDEAVLARALGIIRVAENCRS